MPICPNCNYEYVEGIVICPDCKTGLIPENQLPKIEEIPEKDWVLVYTSFNEIDAEMLKDNLESAGIGATVLSQKDHNFPAPGDFSVVKLMVKKPDVVAALEFIQQVKNKSEDETDLMNSANLTKRVLVSVVAIPLILLVSYFGSIYFYVFVLILSLLAFHEFANIAKKKAADVNLLIGLFIIAVVISNQYKPFVGLFTLFLLSVLILSITELFRNKNSAVLNLSTSFLGILYIGLFGSSLIAIREFYPVVDDLYTRGGLIIISMLASIWICDSAAYFLGSAFGKHKLFERISPNKSWEGAIAGFIFAIIAMAAAKFSILDFLDWKSAIILGCIIGIVGQVGDLVESMFKRDAVIKDSSTLIPGHGGVFDRFDSLLFTAPVVWLYLKYFV